MKALLLILMSITIFSCSNDVSKKENNRGEQNTNPGKNPGQTIALNKSIVLAELISKSVTDEFNFTLKVKTLEVEEDGNTLSMAVKGEEYTLTPAYYTDENKEIPDNDRNSGLKSLTKLNTGDKFKAEISLEQPEGWIIYRVLK